MTVLQRSYEFDNEKAVLRSIVRDLKQQAADMLVRVPL